MFTFLVPYRLGNVTTQAFPSQNTECPAGAYGRYDGTEFRPSFADQRSRHILSIARSALFLLAATVRIYRVSLVA